MATIDIGKLSFTHKGDYASGTAYVLNDVVYYNGSAYIAKQSTTGNAPTSTTHWATFTAGSGGIWNSGLSLGSAGQVVKVNSGASALEFGSISSTSDIEKIVSNTFSGVSALDLNGLTTYFGATLSDYVMYHIYMSDMDFSTSTNLMMRQFNTDSINTGNYYSYGTWAIQSNSSSLQVSYAESGSAFKLTRDSMRGDTGRLHGLEMTVVNINNNADNKNYLQYWGRCSPVQHDSTGRVHATSFGGNFNSDTTYNTNKTGIRIYPDSGTFSGRYTIFGVRK
jgi:hypothetical protein